MFNLKIAKRTDLDCDKQFLLPKKYDPLSFRYCSIIFGREKGSKESCKGYSRDYVALSSRNQHPFFMLTKRCVGWDGESRERRRRLLKGLCSLNLIRKRSYVSSSVYAEMAFTDFLLIRSVQWK